MSEEKNDQYKQHEWEKYEETKDQFIQNIAKNMNLYEITPSIGRLYGTLYFSDDPMTLDDMRDSLGMSKTSMSNGVRTLLDMKMVEPVFRRGVRKDLYRTEDDWYKSFTALFSREWKQSAETNIEETNEAKDELLRLYEKTDDTSLRERIENDLKRLDYAEEYYDWLLRFVSSVESGKIFEVVPKRKENE
ncbi:GbsR/MarR family transcriptional regulator [Texcoconibacillus texcoconensis]|uniref:HTH-type transcriptional regulator n=1 Tax=Texcoconibacillus texcoconensis TaxID=1095777 RepID=A0A840QPK0_9BACI|nr:GbsR/MarR family transcriptional regulator [Texcoconibacillus texcoconensis]MBB5173247.1 DNA-binding transcriptional regulator GbsR (MarR family) [Texcoconibacillus texcoconensis]